MTWKFGQYIQKVLDEKGGKKAGWTQSRLADLAGLSATQIGWIIHGETSAKKGPPSLHVDTLLSLSDALGVPGEKLLTAYKGGDPSQSQESCDASSQAIQEILNILLKTVPHRVFAEALIQHDGVDKVRDLLKEALDRQKREQNAI